MSASSSRIPTVLVVGASGYLGSTICNAFLRTSDIPLSSSQDHRQFRVYGLIRRAAAAQALAAAEVIPIVGSLPDRDTLKQTVLSNSQTWDVIVTCTEPSRAEGPEAEAKHWDDVLSLVQSLAAESSKHGVRPFVIWSSGCKDYGNTGLHGDPDLGPHTETSPLVTHPIIQGRMDSALRVIEIAKKDESAGFDAAAVRATPVHGYSGSYYGAAFEYVSTFKRLRPDESVLKLPADARTIMHGLHIDDCADGYVAIANAALFRGQQGRESVSGEVFNISGSRYETLQEVGEALAKEYGFKGGASFGATPEELPHEISGPGIQLVFGWSQWVDSAKIRRLTGWTDRRFLFSENIHVYRLAYEAAAAAKEEGVQKVRRRMEGNWGDQ